MSTVEQSIDVEVPVRVAYDQWTQFESFPRFMDGVVRVVQGDDKTLLWWVVGRRSAQAVDRGDRRSDARTVASPGRARKGPRTPAPYCSSRSVQPRRGSP